MSTWRDGGVHFLKVGSSLSCGFSFLLLGALGFALPGLDGQTGRTVRVRDNSDWWSGTRKSNSEESIQPQDRELAKTNFQVLEVTLGETMFSDAARKLGSATIVERGDASTGRSQACYASPGAQDKVYLIFEQDEVGYSFYLFAEGPPWKGSDYCLSSEAISRSLGTASGLRLGQTPAQVIGILGKPTRRGENQLVYSLLVRKKTSPKDLKEARERNPEMSEKDFQANYAYYNLGVGVRAKFKDSKLTYLAVSKVESN